MPRSIVPSLSPTEVVLEKNTFLEVLTENDLHQAEDELPRTISDQTHTREKRAKYIASIPAIVECATTDEQPMSGATAAALTGPVSRCQWHAQSGKMGLVTENGRKFTKKGYHGLLSILTEEQLHESGVHRYLVHVDEETDNFSSADGFGFIFGNRLPFSSNIRNIQSIFINKRGEVCTRLVNRATEKHCTLAAVDVGRSVEMVVDLDNLVISFAVFDANDACLGTSGPVDFAATADLTGKSGFFGAVIKFQDTTLTFR